MCSLGVLWTSIWVFDFMQRLLPTGGSRLPAMHPKTLNRIGPLHDGTPVSDSVTQYPNGDKASQCYQVLTDASIYSHRTMGFYRVYKTTIGRERSEISMAESMPHINQAPIVGRHFYMNNG